MPKFEDYTKGGYLVTDLHYDTADEDYPIVDDVTINGYTCEETWTIDDIYLDGSSESHYDLIPLKAEPLKIYKVH